MSEIEQDSIITLLDENDREVEFDVVMTFDYEGKRYVALLPTEEVEDVEEDEVVILEYDKNDTLKSIENPILLQEVFDEFLELFDEQFDEEDE